MTRNHRLLIGFQYTSFGTYVYLFLFMLSFNIIIFSLVDLNNRMNTKSDPNFFLKKIQVTFIG